MTNLTKLLLFFFPPFINVKCITIKNFSFLYLFFFFSQILNKLKVLNLSNSKRLTKSPNFSQVPKLEILILEGCTGLVKIHETIGGLGKLVLLNLKGCKSLMDLPSNISNLESLKTLDLSGCLKIDKLPDKIGNMMALTKLFADEVAIKQLPSSFVLLKNLEIASLSGCKEQPSKPWVSPLSSLMSPKSCLSLLSSLMSSKSLNPICFLPPSISGLCSLTSLNLSGRNLSENEFPVDFVSLSSLEFLDLSRNNFCNLPDCIKHLPKLCNLLLRECTALQSISGLSASIDLLDTSDCTSMKRLSISSNHERGLLLDLRNCPELVEIQGLEDLESASIHSKGCNNLEYDFRSPFQVLSLSLPPPPPPPLSLSLSLSLSHFMM
jgi:Leucine-rich repeat (LRR) protein